MNIKESLIKEKKRLLFIKKYYKVLNVRNKFIRSIVHKLYNNRKLYPLVFSLLMSCGISGFFVHIDGEKETLNKSYDIREEVNSLKNEKMLFYNEPYYTLENKEVYLTTYYDDFNEDDINYYFSLSKSELDKLLSVKEYKLETLDNYYIEGLNYVNYERKITFDSKVFWVFPLEYIAFLLFNGYLWGLFNSVFLNDYVNSIYNKYDDIDEDDIKMLNSYLKLIEDDLDLLGDNKDATRKR